MCYYRLHCLAAVERYKLEKERNDKDKTERLADWKLTLRCNLNEKNWINLEFSFTSTNQFFSYYSFITILCLYTLSLICTILNTIGCVNLHTNWRDFLLYNMTYFWVEYYEYNIFWAYNKVMNNMPGKLPHLHNVFYFNKILLFFFSSSFADKEIISTEFTALRENLFFIARHGGVRESGVWR